MSKVCLDAGHYGKYNRSPANPSYYESVQMWKLHQLLATELQARGVSVVQTRTAQGADLALITRGKRAKGCDLFISLHSNGTAAGTVNDAVDYPVAYVMSDKAGTDIDEKSAEIGLRLAKVVQRVMSTKQAGRTSTRPSGNDRDGNGVKDDEYYGVLQGAKTVGVPGVILEHSFHTSSKATVWLLSDANLQRMAEAEADCIVEWLKGQTPAAPAKPTPAKTPEPAKAKSATYAKTWTVTASVLNMRMGAGTDKDIVAQLPKGTAFRCYGYYTKNGSTVWLYGVANGKTGYCSKNYLK